MMGSILWKSMAVIGVLGLLAACATPQKDPNAQGQGQGAYGSPIQQLHDANKRPILTHDGHQLSDWRLHVEILVLPRDRDLSAAAAGMDEPPIGHAKRLLWNYNGFAIGQVANDALGLFRPLLGRTIDRTQTFTLQNATTFQPIPLNRRDAQVDLATSHSLAEQAVESKRFTRGRFQLLLRVDPKKDLAQLEQNNFTILPQHHRPKPSAFVRPIHEKLMDGTLFEDLRLSLPIEPDQSLVIFAKLPALPDQANPTHQPEVQNNPELPGLRTPPPVAIKPQRSLRLAEAMLSGRLKKTNQKVQVVVIIRSEKKPSSVRNAETRNLEAEQKIAPIRNEPIHANPDAAEKPNAREQKPPSRILRRFRGR